MTKQGWATLAIVAIPLAALFGPALIGDRTFAMRDAAHFYYPLFEWCCREWSAGRVPLWNPYENCGLPVLADTTSSIFYPGKLVFLLPADFALRYKLYVVMHVVLAAAGSYWLARAWKASCFAAGAAAIAYACGGSVAFQYCNVVFLVGAAWLPFAALAADVMLRERSWRAALALGVVLALMILGGDPQAAYHVLLITGLYAVILMFTHGESPEPKRGRLRTASLRIGLTGMAAVIGFLLAAVQILPSSEATQYSERAAFDRPRNIYEAIDLSEHGTAGDEPPLRAIAQGLFGTPDRGTHQDLAYDFSVGPWRLAEYFWPNIGGRMLPTNRRWLSLLPWEGRTWTPTLYLGLVPVLLALAAWRVRGGEARQRWLSWLVLIFTLASFGSYVYWLMVTLLPTYIYFRYPAKLLPLVSLAVSQLAAIGWDRTIASQNSRFRYVLCVLAISSGVAAFIVWCLGTTTGLFPRNLPADASLGPFDRQGAYRDVLWALVQTAVVASAAAWLLRKLWSEPARHTTWQLGLLLMTAVEVGVANHWLVITAPASVMRAEPAAARAIAAASPLAENQPPLRVFRGNLGNWRPPNFREQASSERPAQMAAWERDTLFPKYHLPTGISLVESYGSIKLLDYESLLFVARSHGPPQPDKTLLPQPTALRLTATDFVLLPEKQSPAFAERVEVPKGDHWPQNAALWRMQRTFPRAWIVHEVIVLPPLPRPRRLAATDARTADVLFPGKRARDFQRVAVVETDQPLPEWSQPPPDVAPIAAESCRIAHFSPQRVVVEAELPQPGLLVLSEAWFPGWQATVTTAGQSQPATIYRTNRVLRGVWLSAGLHTVEFRYWPESFVRGAWMSGASWLALLACCALVGLRGLTPPARRQIE